MEKYINQIAHRDGLLAEDDESILPDDDSVGYDNSQIMIETVMPEEVRIYIFLKKSIFLHSSFT